jgi:hypothetical protein
MIYSIFICLLRNINKKTLPHKLEKGLNKSLEKSLS